VRAGECLTERALSENKNTGDIDVDATTDRFPGSAIQHPRCFWLFHPDAVAKCRTI
jgi:hypothetical protein